MIQPKLTSTDEIMSALLNQAVRNKGTALTVDQQKRLGLEGLLRSSVEACDAQVQAQIQSKVGPRVRGARAEAAKEVLRAAKG